MDTIINMITAGLVGAAIATWAVSRDLRRTVELWDECMTRHGPWKGASPDVAGLQCMQMLGRDVDSWEEIEGGIVDRLRLIVDAGYRTISSCDGHGQAPWITVEGTDVQGLHRALMDGGESRYRIMIDHMFPFPVDDRCRVSMVVEWWDPFDERRTEGRMHVDTDSGT